MTRSALDHGVVFDEQVRERLVGIEGEVVVEGLPDGAVERCRIVDDEGRGRRGDGASVRGQDERRHARWLLERVDRESENLARRALEIAVGRERVPEVGLVFHEVERHLPRGAGGTLVDVGTRSDELCHPEVAINVEAVAK